jgi:hypothetical protein
MKSLIRKILNEEAKKITGQEIIGLFNRQLEKRGNLNFHGLILKPKYNGKSIIFNVDNPNDLSYSQPAMENHIDSMFNKFIRLFKQTRFTLQVRAEDILKVNTGRYYLNKKDYDTIKEKILNVKNFRVSLNGLALLGDVKFGDSNIFSFNVYSGYELNISLNAKLTNFKVDYKDNIRDIDETELGEILNTGSNGEIYIDYLHDELFNEALTYIWGINTLIDQNSMSIETNLEL